MPQNIEIEFKNMLTKLEYESLLHTFNISQQQIFTQENHYFDTPDFALNAKNSALRIRKKANYCEMTLKQPAAVGLLETNQVLTEAEAEQAIKFGRLPAGQIQTLIEESGISFSKIEYFGSLTTHRCEINHRNGIIVLDHSLYLNTEDFELEFEVQSYEEGKQEFLELIQKYQIPIRETENKIHRFYKQENSQIQN